MDSLWLFMVPIHEACAQDNQDCFAAYGIWLGEFGLNVSVVCFLLFYRGSYGIKIYVLNVGKITMTHYESCV